MSKPVVISARIDADTAALLDSIAAARGRSRAWVVADAVKRMAVAEADFLAFIQVGVDAADRGDVISSDDIQDWIEQKREALRVRAAAQAA